MSDGEWPSHMRARSAFLTMCSPMPTFTRGTFAQVVASCPFPTATTTAAKKPYLPNELYLKIVKYCDCATLKALRFVSPAMRDLATEVLFAEIHVAAVKDILDNFSNIAQTPALAIHVKKLVYIAEVVSIDGIMGREQHKAGLHEDLPHKPRDIIFSEQVLLLNQSYGASILHEAFKSLPNLHSVEVAIGPKVIFENPMAISFAAKSQVRLQELFWSRKVENHIPWDRPINILFQALSRDDNKIREISIDSIPSWILGADLFTYRDAQGIRKSQEFPHLTKVRLAIEWGEDFRYPGFSSVAYIPTFFCSAPNLVEVVLVNRTEERGIEEDDDLGTSTSGSSVKSCGPIINKLLPAITLPKLQVFQVDSGWMLDNTMARFLKRHAKTLQTLKLEGMEMVDENVESIKHHHMAVKMVYFSWGWAEYSTTFEIFKASVEDIGDYDPFPNAVSLDGALSCSSAWDDLASNMPKMPQLREISITGAWDPHIMHMLMWARCSLPITEYCVKKFHNEVQNPVLAKYSEFIGQQHLAAAQGLIPQSICSYAYAKTVFGEYDTLRKIFEKMEDESLKQLLDVDDGKKSLGDDDGEKSLGDDDGKKSLDDDDGEKSLGDDDGKKSQHDNDSK